MSDQSAVKTPLPWKQLISIFFVIFSDLLTLVIVFPFVPFMVEDFGITNDKREIGRYVGFIASALSLAQLTTLFWGWLSDRKSRKMIIYIGLVGNAVFSTLFGLSTSLPMAVLMRFLCGAVNGNFTVALSMVGEITDETNAAQGFAIFGVTFGIASFVAPFLAGTLSKPVELYPSLLGGNQFLTRYPYFLPNFACALFSIMGLVASAFFLVDPREKKGAQTTFEGKKSQVDVLSKPAKNIFSELFSNLRSFRGFPNLNISAFFSLFSFSFISFIQVAVDEVYSLWCKQAVNQGGLGWEIKEVGESLSFAGVVTLFIQVIVYPKLDQRLGTKNCFKASMILYGIVLMANPWLNKLALSIEEQGQSSLVLWIPLLILLTFRALAATSAFTSGMLLVSQCAQQTGSSAGLINGLSTCMASLVRMGAPVMAGVVWSWSLFQDSYPFNFHCIFVLLSLTSFLAAISTLLIRPSLSSSTTPLDECICDED